MGHVNAPLEAADRVQRRAFLGLQPGGLDDVLGKRPDGRRGHAVPRRLCRVGRAHRAAKDRPGAGLVGIEEPGASLVTVGDDLAALRRAGDDWEPLAIAMLAERPAALMLDIRPRTGTVARRANPSR